MSRKRNRPRRFFKRVIPLVGALIVVAIMLFSQTNPGSNNNSFNPNSNRLFAANCDSSDPGTNQCQSDISGPCCDSGGQPEGCTWCYCGGCKQGSPSSSPPAPTCSVTISDIPSRQLLSISTGTSSTSGPGYYRINYSGQGGTLRIWAINPNDSEYLPTNLPAGYISATADSSTHIDPSWAPGSHYYKIHSVDCSSADGCTSGSYKDVLFPGNKGLYIYCDVIDVTSGTQCSGNPYCSYESSAIKNHDCGNSWRSCSDSDNKVILSGKITNELTGQPLWIPNVIGIYNTVGPNEVCDSSYMMKVADRSGYYSVANVPIGGGYCVRVPSSYTGYSSPKGGNGTSFECQIAGGYYNPDVCSRTGNDNLVNSSYVNYTTTSTIGVGNVVVNDTSKRYVVSGASSGNGYIDVGEWTPRAGGGWDWYVSHKVGDPPFGVARSGNFLQAAENVNPSGGSVTFSNVSFREVTGNETNYNLDVSSDRNLDFTYRPDCNTCTPSVCNGTARCDQSVSGTGSCTATTYNSSSTNCTPVTLTNQPCTIPQSTCDSNQTCNSSGVCVNNPSGLTLQIGNNSNVADHFTSTLKISGLQSTQGGKGWYNPFTITLTAVKGTGDLRDYYVAFYDKSLTEAITASTFLADVTANFNSATKAKNGFLLGYSAASAKYYVWDYSATTSTVGASNCNTNGCFVDITGYSPFGYQVCSAACTPQTLLYTAYPVSAASWKVALDKNYGSKTMYTATYVTDSNNLSAFNANIDPVYP